MGFKSRLNTNTSARVSVFVATFVAVLGMMVSPALASTSVSGSVFGSPCGTNSMFANFSGTATMSGNNSKADFANLKFGATVHLPGGCGIANQLCVDSKALLDASGAIGPGFTDIYQEFTTGSRTVAGTSAWETSTTCTTINSAIGGISVDFHRDGNDDLAFLYTEVDGSKINDYTLYSRARILYNGNWVFTAYASQTIHP